MRVGGVAGGGVFVCSRQQVEERGFLHVLELLTVQRLGPGAPHQTQPARRNEIPIIFN